MTQLLNVLNINNLFNMLISDIKLNGVDHKLIYPIDISEEDYVTSGGKRMTKLYNTTFGLLCYATELESAKNCMKEEVNLIINSYLFDSTYIHNKNLLDECLVLRDKIVRCVYG